MRCGVVITQISATDAPTSEHLMGAQGDIKRPLICLCRDRRRRQVIGSAHRILCRVVIKTALRNNLADAKRAISHYRNGELAPRNEALDQYLATEAPTSHLFAPGIVIDPHDADSDAGTLVGRFDNEGGGHRIA